ncbi:MAG: hypothetical protein ACJ75F_05795 [Flavisolibacter sp.]
MKKLQAPIAGAIILLLATAGCRKDFQENHSSNSTEATPTLKTETVKQNGITESEWQGNLSWTSVERPTYSIFFTTIKSDISAETADAGIVRVFKSSANGKQQSLPFEETVNGQKYYWYYQVTEGTVMIAVDAYGSKNNPADASLFKTVVLNKDAVTSLVAKGNSRAGLMDMSVETITAVK